MAKRKQSATVDVKLRMKEPLRAALEGAARKRGISMNAEIVERLSRSFNQEAAVEAALGGPEIRRMAMLMVAAFAHNGAMMAHALGHPEWSATDWMKDPSCYREAALSVFEALMVAQAGAGWDTDGCYLEVEALKGRIATWIHNASRAKSTMAGTTATGQKGQTT